MQWMNFEGISSWMIDWLCEKVIQVDKFCAENKYQIQSSDLYAGKREDNK